jgi:hypothetical protein
MTDPSLPDLDHLPLSSLEGRIRSLDEDQLVELLARERSHADRLHVVQVIEARLTAVREGATVTEGSADPARPEKLDAGSDRSATVTEGPPVNPPSHGDPTNPAQPRR